MPNEGLQLVTAPVTSDQLALIKKTIAAGATDDELKLFLYDCQRQGVHPLDKLIHFTKRAGKYTPVTSIDFMRSRAADSCEYAGNDDAVFVEGDRRPEAATVTVYRLVQGQKCAFAATARWSEYVPDNAFMWKKMPYTMLAKCAEALALRKAFPRQLSGLYSAEEMDQAKKQADYTPPTAEEETQAEQQVEESSGLMIVTCKVKQINHKAENVAVVNCILNGREVLLRVDDAMIAGVGPVGGTVTARVRKLPSTVEMYQVLDWLTDGHPLGLDSLAPSPESAASGHSTLISKAQMIEIQRIRKASTIPDASYYAILGANGAEHANELPKGAYKAVVEAITEYAASVKG